jgi:hypothetical protein
MAGILSWVSSGEVTMVSTTAKSVLQIKAPANQRILVRQLQIAGKAAAGGTDAVGKIRVTRSTANFGTFSSATPSKNNPSDSETLQVTAGSNATVEPTSPADGGWWYELNPQTGVVIVFPADKPLIVPGGQSLQFEITVSGTPIYVVSAQVEE